MWIVLKNNLSTNQPNGVAIQFPAHSLFDFWWNVNIRRDFEQKLFIRNGPGGKHIKPELWIIWSNIADLQFNYVTYLFWTHPWNRSICMFSDWTVSTSSREKCDFWLEEFVVFMTRGVLFLIINSIKIDTCSVLYKTSTTFWLEPNRHTTIIFNTFGMSKRGHQLMEFKKPEGSLTTRG